MISQQTVHGRWNEIKGELRSKWNSLTDDDLGVFNGNVDQLIRTIQRKTGEARDNIEQFFEHFTADGAAAMNRVNETARAGAEHAIDAVQANSKYAADAIQRRYADAQDIVRHRPVESAVLCFAAGAITGVLASLFVRSRR